MNSTCLHLCSVASGWWPMDHLPLFFVKFTLIDPGLLGQLFFLKTIRFGRCIFGTFSFCTCLKYLNMCMYIYVYIYMYIYKHIYIYIHIYIYMMFEFSMLALVLCCNWLVAHEPPAIFFVKCTLMDPGPLG